MILSSNCPICKSAMVHYGANDFTNNEYNYASCSNGDTSNHGYCEAAAGHIYITLSNSNNGNRYIQLDYINNQTTFSEQDRGGAQITTSRVINSIMDLQKILLLL